MFRVLRQQLVSRGMPVAEVRRYLRELRDHHADLIAEEVDAGASKEDARNSAGHRLGDPDQLAKAALSSFTRRTFAGRHPLFFYGLLPFFITMLVFALALMPLVAFQESPLVHRWFPLYGRSVFYVVPGLLSPIYYRDAWQRGLSLSWRLLPSVLICTTAFFLILTIRPWNTGWQCSLGIQPHVNLLSGLIPVATTLFLARRLRPTRFRNLPFSQRVKP